MDTSHAEKSFFKAFKLQLKIAIRSFKDRQLLLFWIFCAGLLISTVIMLAEINNKFLVAIPAYGGKIDEGIIGTPRFINPLLAVSDADRDLTSLIYSGLMKRDARGEIVPDLAEEYSISPNGLVYTFRIKSTAVFHDGVPVTANDVIYTVTEATDPLIKSPKRVNWEGVTLRKVDEMTVAFELKKPYAPFIENLTLGILPSHIWKNVGPDEFSFSDWNINAIGAGPYKIHDITRKSSGIPGVYTLSPFTNYANSSAHIRRLAIHFYSNEKDLLRALQSGEVAQVNAISPEHARELAQSGYEIKTTVLPRVFGLFFNQNENKIFADKKVIQAFNVAIDKQKIIEEVLSGYGVMLDSPIPPHLLDNNVISGDTTSIENLYSPTGASEILTKDGWKMGPDGVLVKGSGKTALRLSFSIATGDSPELRGAATIVENNLRSIGAEVETKVFEIGTLNQNVIRTRKYDALFFGQVVTHESDLMAFWHSSQRNDPGLNIAMYTNPKTDKLLESALTTLDETVRNQKFIQFEEEIKNDLPAVFVYSPQFIYVTKKDVSSQSLGSLTLPSDRFSTITDWYIEKDYVWKFFLPHNEVGID